MINTQIELTPRFPGWALVFVFGAVALCVAGLAQQSSELAIGSIPCWTIACSTFMASRRTFQMNITEQGLDVLTANQFVPYESITAISCSGKGPQSEICVTHDGGSLTIPKGIDVDSTTLCDFLRTRFVTRTHLSLPTLLEEFAQEQIQLFGEEKVFRFAARSDVRAPRIGGTRSVAFGIGLWLGAIGWFIAAWATHEDGWVGGGIFLLLAGLLAFLIGLVRRHSSSPDRGIKNWKQSGLVISPVGIALAQGTLQGQLKWSELRGVEFRTSPRSFRMSSVNAVAGIVLKIDGSALAIVDLYNEPLETIHAIITRFWGATG